MGHPDRQEDGGVSRVALSPSGRYFADCRLSATFDPACDRAAGVGPKIRSVSLHARQPMTVLRHDVFEVLGSGSVAQLSSRTLGGMASNIAEIQLEYQEGRTHDIR